MLKRWKYLAVLGVLLLLAGCTRYTRVDYVSDSAVSLRNARVAVVQFANLTNHPKAGDIVSDLLTTALKSTKSFEIMSKEQQARKMDNSMALEQIDSRLKAWEIGQKLGVDTVIFGSVSEYRYKQGLSEDPIVGINLRMVDVATGEIVWSASHTNARGASLNSNTQKVAQRMIVYLLNHMD